MRLTRFVSVETDHNSDSKFIATPGKVQQAEINQVGDIGMIMTAIVAAV